MRVAAAQARSHWLDPAASTRKVVEWMERAAAEDVELVALPEAFLSGYPFWLELTGGARFDDPDQKRAYAAYLDASVDLAGAELATVTEAAGDLGVFVYLGVTERATHASNGTIYCTLVAVDPAQGIVSAHRKLIPTYEERLVWGQGDGHGLRVHSTAGMRVGGLSCWENWMPQARHALYAQGEQLHVSVWPGNPRNTQDIARFIALEGRVFSLAVCGLASLGDVPADFPLRATLEQHPREEVEWVDGRPRRGLSKGGDHRDQDDCHHDQPDDHRHRQRWRHRCVIHGHGLPPRRGWRAHHTVTGPLFRRGVGPDTGQDVSRPRCESVHVFQLAVRLRDQVVDRDAIVGPPPGR